MRHTLYNKLFISESEVAAIRTEAISIINADASHSVANAYIEATLAYLNSKGLLNLSDLDSDSGPRRAHVAEYLKRGFKG